MRSPIVPAAAVVASISLLSGCAPHEQAVGNSRQAVSAATPADVDESSRTPLGMVVTWAKTVKAQARRPDSVKWNNLLANKDGSVVCLEYRTEDEPGTASLKRVAFLTGNGVRAMSSWEQHCTQNLYDMAYAVPFIEGN